MIKAYSVVLLRRSGFQPESRAHQHLIRHPSRGFSLIELMAVLAGVAILLGLCAVTLQLLMRVSDDAQARRTSTAALGRLAEQFREDVHAAEDIQLQPTGTLRLNLGPKAAIEYQPHDGRIDRVESAGGRASRHESYVLNRRGSIVFERRDDGPRHFLALIVRHNVGTGRPDPPHPLEVLALLGKNRDTTVRTKGGQPQ